MGTWAAPHPLKVVAKRVCGTCGKEFETPAWRVEQGKGKYCSKACYALGSRAETGVEHDGLWFARTGKNKYFWHKRSDNTTVSLHKYVWEKHNGPTPEGYAVHHIDHDPSNNVIENLAALPRGEHQRAHMYERRDRGELKFSDNARAAAAAWHGSPAGLAWHAELGKQAWDKRVRTERVCTHCGKHHLSFTPEGRAGYCSPACTAAARRNSGVDDEQRSCVFCGSEFTCNKYVKRRTCGKACWKAAIAESHRGLRTAG